MEDRKHPMDAQLRMTQIMMAALADVTTGSRVSRFQIA
jgi:hypothetical protein